MKDEGEKLSGSRRRGFTLIELLCALVLVAVVLPTALEAIGSALSLAGLSRQRFEAVRLGQSRLDELIATADWDNLDQTGDFGEEAPEFAWVVDVTDFDDMIRLVTLDVLWENRGREQRVSLATLVNVEGR